MAGRNCQVKNDLQRFLEFIEGREVETGGLEGNSRRRQGRGLAGPLQESNIADRYFRAK